MSKDSLFNHVTVQDVDSLSDYLDAVREGFRQGKLTLKDKRKELTFEPQGLVDFHLGAKRTDNHCTLTLKFSWREGADEIKEDALRITTG